MWGWCWSCPMPLLTLCAGVYGIWKAAKLSPLWKKLSPSFWKVWLCPRCTMPTISVVELLKHARSQHDLLLLVSQFSPAAQALSRLQVKEIVVLTLLQKSLSYLVGINPVQSLFALINDLGLILIRDLILQLVILHGALHLVGIAL